MNNNPHIPKNGAPSEIEPIDRLKKKLVQIFPFIEYEVSLNEDKALHITFVKMKKDGHGHGYGRKIIAALCDYSDRNGIDTEVNVGGFEESEMDQLIPLYQSYGFEFMDTDHERVTDEEWQKWDSKNAIPMMRTKKESLSNLQTQI